MVVVQNLTSESSRPLVMLSGEMISWDPQYCPSRCPRAYNPTLFLTPTNAGHRGKLKSPFGPLTSSRTRYLARAYPGLRTMSSQGPGNWLT
ncbi:hypothetical protein N7468_001102 [Penicillium chermesinum]|uniref:Uncharacterized protein n=1 Tax=Penicillium chermesinum TaxID=63820 RepID=A0A9W9PG77_9EURO|nr:uncharacterized protein N7468_001102 [Penicillium chermesinum]KAJ5246119.1 hypothetical protein N7468_001102 [Penicillium chermesinum]